MLFDYTFTYNPLMRRAYFVFCLLFLSACSSQLLPSATSGLYAIRLDPPALIRFDSSLETIARESALDLPPGCAVWSLDPSPSGPYAALELACAGGPAVLLLDLNTTEIHPLVKNTDSHFLAWDADGQGLFLRVDSLGNARIVRATVDGKFKDTPLTGFTYDLSVSPDGTRLAHTFTRGIGYGSELWLTDENGRNPRLLLSEPNDIITFAHWSPDGQTLAYILMPDSQIPFPNGELWWVDAGDGVTRFVAAADAGHGYAFAWSPDGRQIAFVGRDNADDPQVSQSLAALHSNLYLVGLDGTLEKLTQFEEARVEAPRWSADGNWLAFPVVLQNGTINLWVHNLDRGETALLNESPSCCPAWVGK